MLLLAILFSVLLLVNFRLHAKWGINTSIAILLNYPICFLVGYLMQPEAVNQLFDLSMANNIPVFLLGIGFIVTFLFSGKSTVKNGMAVTSLANNMSLVLPVVFSLMFLGAWQSAQWNSYLGLALAFVAIYFFSPKINSENNSIVSPVLLIAVFLCYGITNSTFNYLNKETAPLLGGTIPFMLLALIGSIVAGLLVLIFQMINKQITLDPKSVLASIPLGIPNFLSFYYLLKALDQAGNNGALVMPIYNIGVIAGTALVGLIFFKERLSKLQIAGLAIGTASVILLGL